MPTQTLGNTTGNTTPERDSEEAEFQAALLGVLGQQAQRIAMRQLGISQIDDTAFWDNERKMLAALLLVWLLRIGETGIASTVTRTMTPAGLGVSDAVNARAAAGAEKHALELARGLTKTTREIAKRQISGWLASGGRDIGKLVQLLGETIAPEWRAAMIAQTETTAAWSAALQEIAAEYPEIVGYQWQAQMDERTCVICGWLHGKTRKKGQGYIRDYPPPPAHPRCRCEELLIIELEA